MHVVAKDAIIGAIFGASVAALGLFVGFAEPSPVLLAYPTALAAVQIVVGAVDRGLKRNPPQGGAGLDELLQSAERTQQRYAEEIAAATARLANARNVQLESLAVQAENAGKKVAEYLRKQVAS